MFGRVCRVWIEDIGQQGAGLERKTLNGVKFVIYENLDVKFSITKDASGYVYGGNISVCNLNWDTICLYMSKIGLLDWDERKCIRLEVGYEDSGYECIFSGRVLKAQPTVAPDVWLEFFVMTDELCSGDPLTVCEISHKFGEPIDMNSVLEQFAKQIPVGKGQSQITWSPANFKPKDKSILKKQMSFSATGRYIDVKRKIEQYLQKGCMLTVTDGKLYVVSSFDEKPLPEANSIGSQSVTIGDDVILGIPRFDYPHVSVTTLLNPFLKPFQNVKIDMKIEKKRHEKDRYEAFTKFNYYINTLVHSGHFRGDGWTTKIDLLNMSDIAKNVTPEKPLPDKK